MYSTNCLEVDWIIKRNKINCSRAAHIQTDMGSRTWAATICMEICKNLVTLLGVWGKLRVANWGIALTPSSVFLRISRGRSGHPGIRVKIDVNCCNQKSLPMTMMRSLHLRDKSVKKCSSRKSQASASTESQPALATSTFWCRRVNLFLN